MPTVDFAPGTLVSARGREWVVLPQSRGDVLRLRPLGGSADDATCLYVPMEETPPEPARFPAPDPTRTGNSESALLLQDALRMALRAGAGPFRGFGNLAVEPRAYQLVPLLMALKLDPVRLLVADDVGVGKTIEAGLIARELFDRGEIRRITVLCPPHLCEQWKSELLEKFQMSSEIVRPGTAARLERGLPAGRSLFEAYPITVVSLDYIKADRRRDEFLHTAPEFVIVEEAHACVHGSSVSRHQRYKLLSGLAADPRRHMVMLTATPHSGDEEAFYNLLSLLDPRFGKLQDVEGRERDHLRGKLAEHFVQRRRPDIAEWKDATTFPDRETAEVTYKITGDWGEFFRSILDYARGMVERASGGTHLEQRMSWWAALALLRCAGSSPDAARAALQTRLKKLEGFSAEEEVRLLDAAASEAVFDGDEGELSEEDAAPAGRRASEAENAEDQRVLGELLGRTTRLVGIANDPKLRTLVRELRPLLHEGFHPVIFCRYLATADYLACHLRESFAKEGYEVQAVTGETPPEERREKIDALGEADKRILVATDCLSEGINLQNVFDAVVHYDLSWNPTRHEQREGRVDRYGQGSKKVRCLMLYGEDNPVDGAVLRVILRKADRIRRELGVSVPVPGDANKVMEEVLQAVLTKKSSSGGKQLSLAYGEDPTDPEALDHVESTLEKAWESAREQARRHRTIFAQSRLNPEDVMPEWRRTLDALGGEDDVERFVRTALRRLGLALEGKGPRFNLPTAHLPEAVRHALEAVGIPGDKTLSMGFRLPLPSGTHHVHRTHPLCTALADHVAEVALAGENPKLVSRCGAVFAEGLSKRKTLYTVRLRCQILETLGGREHALLAEECVSVARDGSGAPYVLDEDQARRLLGATPPRNMGPALRERHVREALEALPQLQEAMNDLAAARADALLKDHLRVRSASAIKTGKTDVVPCLPGDVVGVCVLVPAVVL